MIRIQLIVLALLLAGSFGAFSRTPVTKFNSNNAARVSSLPVINTLDSLIFDLANATLTETYIELPVYIRSDDAVIGIDYALKFNLSKLTYASAIDLLPLSSAAHFNANDLFLRYTGGASQNLPASGNVHITKIRFTLSRPCVPISAADFSNLCGYLNGVMCASRMTSLDFSQFYPRAGFKTGPACQNAIIQFSDTTTIRKGSLASWSWNFGNGTSSTLQNNVTTYTLAGPTIATLVVAANTGCKDSLSRQLVISPPPFSGFLYQYSCIKDTMYFTNTSIAPIGSIAQSQWYFGDLSPISTATNPSHHFAASGFYRVKLTVTSSASCTSSTIVEVPLRPSDINRDGLVDIDDFLILAPAYNTACH